MEIRVKKKYDYNEMEKDIERQLFSYFNNEKELPQLMLLGKQEIESEEYIFVVNLVYHNKRNGNFDELKAQEKRIIDEIILQIKKDIERHNNLARKAWEKLEYIINDDDNVNQLEAIKFVLKSEFKK
ncbi:MAG TPA: hypothetical protein DIC60_04155 [Lachnospiraceae bacterium]|nr:hypothetical protein [Lachnospiraceae bacterium]